MPASVPFRTGIVLALLAVAVAVTAPVLAPYDPRATVGPPLSPPSAAHWLGTNNLGQDLLSRLWWGGRPLLARAVLVTVLASAVSLVTGAAAGLASEWGDQVLMRLVDVAVALPRLPLLMLVGALSDRSPTVLTVSLALLLWAPGARVVRNQTRRVRKAGYLAAARGFGGQPGYLLAWHLAPAVAPLLTAQAAATFRTALLLDATLAFVGISRPDSVNWGLDLHRCFGEPGLYLTPAWLWWAGPTGLALTLSTVTVTLLHVGLESALERLRSSAVES